MKRLLIIIATILVSTATTFAFDANLEMTGEVKLLWQSAVINNVPVNYGLSKSKADVDLDLDISKKYDNTRVGLHIQSNPALQNQNLTTKIEYEEAAIPPDAINKQGPFVDQYGKEYWIYQTYETSTNITTYGYLTLDYDTLYINAQTDNFKDFIETNLLEGFAFSESPGVKVEFIPFQNSKVKISASNGQNNKINAIIQAEYYNNYYELTGLSGGFGYQLGDKEAIGAWAKAEIPDYNATITAEYGIQGNLSALGLFAKYKGLLESNISFIVQDHGFISANDDTIIFGDKIGNNNADEVILSAAFRKYGYNGYLISVDCTMNVIENIKLGVLYNALSGNSKDEEFNPIMDKISYKINIISTLTEDLTLDFWYAAWGKNNITSIEGTLHFNDYIRMSAGYKMKELYDFENVVTLKLTGQF